MGYHLFKIKIKEVKMKFENGCNSVEIINYIYDKSGLRIEYSLYETKFKVHGRRIYSICITSKYNNIIESVFTSDISRFKPQAIYIFKTLCKNTVTPCTLNDVLENIL